MAKVYTSQEMREAADNFWVSGVICEVRGEDGRVMKHIKHDAIIAMIRQAADAMEREERREKKYEYKVLYRRRNGRADESIIHTEDIKTARRILGIYAQHEDAHIVRREVGEWKEVKK